ncbi:MAG: VCBS repeat-containing protein, partial [Candidatus Thermoplasmatota archaeon]|nr:VCBS repeat-containing protein [Candidatus Thermoplasmatota archaeon]
SMDPKQALLYDLDSDGDLDIVAVSKSSDSVLIYRNKGSGSFMEPYQYYVGLNPTSVELMDFDSDGDQDIITSDWKGWEKENGENGTVSVLINLRNGIFGTYKQYKTGNSPRGVFTKDVDGDGDMEIASANYFGSTVSILKNDGLGMFSSPMEYPIGLEPYAVVMEDFDGDGNIDGASADEANFRIVLLRSDGDGGFTTDRYLYDIGAYPFSLRTGDIDSDGDMDLYTSNYFQNSTTLLFNDGSGDFSTMFNEYKTIYLGSNMPYDSIIEDVDGDGLKDLVTVNRGDTLDPTDTISVMINDGSYDFDVMSTYEVGTEPTSAVMYDLDSDGDLDIATANTGGDTISVMLNDGSGAFFKLGDYPAGDRPQYINILDFDDDGWMDLIATNTDTNNLIFLRNMGGTDFEPVQDLNIGSYPYAIDTADLDDDGRDEIVISIVNTNNILVLGSYWYPMDILIDIGADGTIDRTFSGLITDDDLFEIDMTEELKEYLDDLDNKNGNIKIPIRVIAGREGIVVLSDLMVIYS